MQLCGDRRLRRLALELHAAAIQDPLHDLDDVQRLPGLAQDRDRLRRAAALTHAARHAVALGLRLRLDLRHLWLGRLRLRATGRRLPLQPLTPIALVLTLALLQRLRILLIRHVRLDRLHHGSLRHCHHLVLQ